MDIALPRQSSLVQGVIEVGKRSSSLEIMEENKRWTMARLARKDNSTMGTKGKRTPFLACRKTRSFQMKTSLVAERQEEMMWACK